MSKITEFRGRLLQTRGMSLSAFARELEVSHTMVRNVILRVSLSARVEAAIAAVMGDGWLSKPPPDEAA